MMTDNISTLIDKHGKTVDKGEYDDTDLHYGLIRGHKTHQNSIRVYQPACAKP